MKKDAGWEWINKMGQAWIDKKPEVITSLFAEKFKYYETPFEKPITNKTNLIKLWLDVPDSQKNISFNFEIISEKNRQYTAHWRASFTRIPSGIKAELDGIFLIKLNQHDSCTLFKQWWISKEK
ncbi:MAG: hypothetical protein UV73_C0004G0101 [Candidatus Gottesmanbacteria bacterium GW2011_GWA2_43_14]|uniref:SnoaL-like domain-containing protein n=1 Tax=Candidatus Gottesmanbacteria bacterium GW2011_GWA2_43_14 TaxID=1618443 RepID=A0A0G1DJV7_9BACT|nr:MAG: hypothetical protein UV73_C0004G0101 [Candidatus Gottesmanbacteria bacterium GW2011_GWA2_43_14]